MAQIAESAHLGIVGPIHDVNKASPPAPQPEAEASVSDLPSSVHTAAADVSSLAAKNKEEGLSTEGAPASSQSELVATSDVTTGSSAAEKRGSRGEEASGDAKSEAAVCRHAQKGALPNAIKAKVAKLKAPYFCDECEKARVVRPKGGKKGAGKGGGKGKGEETLIWVVRVTFRACKLRDQFETFLQNPENHYANPSRNKRLCSGGCVSWTQNSQWLCLSATTFIHSLEQSLDRPFQKRMPVQRKRLIL